MENGGTWPPFWEDRALPVAYVVSSLSPSAPIAVAFQRGLPAFVSIAGDYILLAGRAFALLAGYAAHADGVAFFGLDVDLDPFELSHGVT